MRKAFLLGLTACTLAAAIGTAPVNAQPAPPPGADDHGSGMRPPMPGMHGPMEERGPMHHMGGWMHRMRQFALIYPVTDRALSGPDVQKIAEAFLLFNGNHTWKVTEVTEEANRVTFALATPDGTAIAHFAMDRHTGRPERLS